MGFVVSKSAVKYVFDYLHTPEFVTDNKLQIKGVLLKSFTIKFIISQFCNSNHDCYQNIYNIIRIFNIVTVRHLKLVFVSKNLFAEQQSFFKKNYLEI